MQLDSESEAKLREYLRFAEDPKTNDHLFSAWEWLRDLTVSQPQQAWDAFQWLVARAPTSSVLETIGCGPLADFLLQHPKYAESVASAAQVNERFYLAARWCWLDEEDVGNVAAQEFEATVKASPFAPKE